MIERHQPVRRGRATEPRPVESPRHAALAILESVARGEPFDAARDRAVDSLQDRDRRLAHELAAGVLRHQGELDHAVAPLVPRGLESVAPGIRQILRLGAYQLLHLHRVPAHAAVCTAVDLARAAGGDRSAGFVNAVLRRITRPAAPPERVGPGLHSHPDWLVERWQGRFGEAETTRLIRWNNTRPSLVIQEGRWTESRIAAALDEAGIRHHKAPQGAGLVVEARRPAVLPGFAAGGWYIQDPAQALVVRYLDPPANVTVYDACAAPGGKTLALGKRVRRVVAGEARRDRLARLRDNLARAGTGHEFVVVADANHPPLRPVEVVLLDAPCLGTGTLARHPDARHRVSREGLARLVDRQATLLRAAARVVSPGGLLGYSTCSLEPEENQDQVDRFLAEHPEFRREAPAGFPAGLLSEVGDLELLPQRHGTDGAYAARLRRIA